MKKLPFLLIGTIICAVLCGCGSAESPEDTLFSIVDEENNVTLTLGMTREELEPYLAVDPESEACSVYMSTGESEDYTAVVIHLDRFNSTDAYNYSMKNGISISSSLEDFKQQYPSAVMNADGDRYTVYYQKNGNKYTDISDRFNDNGEYNSQEIDPASVYYVWYSVGSLGIPTIFGTTSTINLNQLQMGNLLHSQNRESCKELTQL